MWVARMNLWDAFFSLRLFYLFYMPKPIESSIKDGRPSFLFRIKACQLFISSSLHTSLRSSPAERGVSPWLSVCVPCPTPSCPCQTYAAPTPIWTGHLWSRRIFSPLGLEGLLFRYIAGFETAPMLDSGTPRGGAFFSPKCYCACFCKTISDIFTVLFSFFLYFICFDSHTQFFFTLQWCFRRSSSIFKTCWMHSHTSWNNPLLSLFRLAGFFRGDSGADHISRDSSSDQVAFITKLNHQKQFIVATNFFHLLSMRHAWVNLIFPLWIPLDLVVVLALHCRSFVQYL